MEKIVIAVVITVIGFWISGKPWVIPPDTGPKLQPPMIEKPAYNNVPQPSKDIRQAVPAPALN